MNKKYYFITGLVVFVCLLISACGHKGNPRPPTEMVMVPPRGGENLGLTIAPLRGEEEWATLASLTSP